MRPKKYTPRHKRESSGRRFNGRKDIDAMYGPEWESYRGKFLAINPRCYACGERATVVDHITPHKGDAKLFEKTDNHLPLCKRDHDRVTALFDMRYRSGNTIEPKLKWLKNSRVSRDLTFRVKVLPSYP